MSEVVLYINKDCINPTKKTKRQQGLPEAAGQRTTAAKVQSMDDTAIVDQMYRWQKTIHEVSVTFCC